MAWNGVLNAGTNWAYIDDADARKQLRNVYKNYTKWKKKANKLADRLRLTSDKEYYEKFVTATGIEIVADDEEEFIL